VEDATVDIVAEGFDAGIRFGERLGGDMIAIPVGPPVEFAVVGSHSYLSQRTRPLTPDDLKEHACIRYRMRGSGRLFDWEFEHAGREFAMTVDGPLTLDAPEFMVRAALDGLGLAYVALFDAEPYLRSGKLVRVLADWCPPTARLQLYYPNRHHVPATLRALIDWLRT
jgi:DNA-binding transcriptional LysR family regulator